MVCLVNTIAITGCRQLRYSIEVANPAEPFMILDGVTQYHLDWKPAPLPRCANLPALNHWRTRFHDLGVIGQNKDRYGGVGFGNVSCRLNSPEFIISGTQPGPPIG